jgi:hypothetical protein
MDNGRKAIIERCSWLFPNAGPGPSACLQAAEGSRSIDITNSNIPAEHMQWKTAAVFCRLRCGRRLIELLIPSCPATCYHFHDIPQSAGCLDS